MNKLLEVNNLRVSFHTYAGEVQAVRVFLSRLTKAKRLPSWVSRGAENSDFQSHYGIDRYTAR